MEERERKREKEGWGRGGREGREKEGETGSEERIMGERQVGTILYMICSARYNSFKELLITTMMYMYMHNVHTQHTYIHVRNTPKNQKKGGGKKKKQQKCKKPGLLK